METSCSLREGKTQRATAFLLISGGPSVVHEANGADNVN